VGLADSIGSPASGALIVDLVGKKRLLAANSIGELANYTGEIVAPVLVDVLIASVGIDSTFYAAAIALGLGVLFILRVPSAQPIETNADSDANDPQNLFTAMRDGFRYARNAPGIAPLLLLASRTLFGAALFPMIPIYARDVLGVGSSGFAVMMAALGAGFISGSLIGALGSVGRRGLVIFALIAVRDVGIVIFSQSDWYVFTVVLIFVMGVAGALTDNLITVSVQQLTEDNMRSRVSGLHRFVNYLDPLSDAGRRNCRVGLHRVRVDWRCHCQCRCDSVGSDSVAYGPEALIWHC
jgi:MFS family permease